MIELEPQQKGYQLWMMSSQGPYYEHLHSERHGPRLLLWWPVGQEPVLAEVIELGPQQKGNQLWMMSSQGPYYEHPP